MTQQFPTPAIKPCANVEAMAAYALADLSVADGMNPIMLAQNESLRPPSPRVAKKVQQTLSTAHFYPDPNWTNLRTAIAEVHSICPNNILCGVGSMELIAALGQAYANPDNRILSTEYGYAFFHTVAKATRAGFDIAPENELTVCVDALLNTVRPDTRLVFIANPGNPSGTRISRDEILRLRKGLPNDVLLVIDEAYGEFSDHLNESMFDLVEQNNTVVLRTFSKAYGLAGMRVGWGLFPGFIAEQVRKLLNPNNIGVTNQVAAEAALSDQAYMRETVAHTAQIRDQFIEQIKTLELEVKQSSTNFVLVRFVDEALAQQADQALRATGILARGMGTYGLPEYLRFTVGDQDSMNKTVETLKNWNEARE